MSANPVNRTVLQQVGRALRGVGWALACAGVLFLLACAVLPLLLQILPRPKDPQTLARIKYLSNEVRLYVADNDDRFPPDMSAAQAALGTFGHSPNLEFALHPGFGIDREWLGNGSLGGRQASSISDPATTILFFDSEPLGGEGHRARFMSSVDTLSRGVSEEVFQGAIANNWLVLKWGHK